MAEPISLPWWKFVRALAPAVLFWAALVGWLAYLLAERTDIGPETDEANLREWIDEARSFRKTLPELIREYLQQLVEHQGDSTSPEVKLKAGDPGPAPPWSIRSPLPGPAAGLPRALSDRSPFSESSGGGGVDLLIRPFHGQESHLIASAVARSCRRRCEWQARA